MCNGTEEFSLTQCSYNPTTNPAQNAMLETTQMLWFEDNVRTPIVANIYLIPSLCMNHDL